MIRASNALVLCAWCVSLASGCANFDETRTIAMFAQALEAGDLEQLKLQSSNEFERKALRLDESLEDFKILRIPDGKSTIMHVEDVSPAEKRVIVQIDGTTQKVKYQLKRDPDTKKWVVDDILLRQRGKGITSAKSVTEQMDLLLTVREFLEAWRGGDRDAIIGTTAPEFGQLLGELPEAYLTQLARRVVRKGSRKSRLKPKADLDADVAVVRLPRTSGDIVLKFELLQGDWKVGDVAVESRSDLEHIPSVKKLATVVWTAVAFLEAYAASDKQALQTLCVPAYFRSSLAPANLSQVKLPAANLPEDSYQIRMQDRFSDFLIETETEIVKLSLTRQERKDDDAPLGFLVDDVTIFELDGTQEKRLSALFTATATLQLFSEAFSAWDLRTLRLTSTLDLNQRVWQRLNDTSFRELPLAEIEDAVPEVLTTVFQGPVTEVTVKQGSRALTYVLRDRNGQLLVDDVLMAVNGRPNSLKKTCELMIPVNEFATALRLQNVDLLQRTSSKDFNRQVWYQAQGIPDIGFKMSSHLRSPLNTIQVAPKKSWVLLGTDEWGARVFLVKEGERYVVDDVQLIRGVAPKHREQMKAAMRLHLATYGVRGRNVPPPAAVDPQTSIPATSSRAPIGKVKSPSSAEAKLLGY